MLGCSSKKVIEPTIIILTYGEFSISAEIEKNKTFDVIRSNEHETVTFSGLVAKQGSGYLVDIVVVRDNKTQHATRQLNTTLLIEMEELAVVGGLNNDVFKVILK